MLISIYILILLQKNIFSLYKYNSLSVLNYINSIKSNETELNNILNLLSKTFKEAYAYNEISKNPPQPFYDKKYHDIVNIENLLKKINTTNISFYDFYKNIINKISEFKDLHIDIYFNNNITKMINDLYIIYPIKFEIKKINHEYKIFGKLNKYYYYYNDQINDINLVEENYINNIAIKSINNLDPFYFIENFCGNVGKTKNPHGSFSHKFNAHYGYNLAIFPLEFQDLNINIVYDNDIKINFEYIFLSTYDIKDLKFFNENKKNNYNDERYIKEKNNNNIDDFLFHEFVKNKKYEEKGYKKIGQLQKEFNKYMNYTRINKKNKNNEIIWDYQYDNETNNIFKCRVDEINKINIYIIQSFVNDNHALFKELFLNCVNLFDNNKYPIIVILNNNNGGYADLSKLMIELISPYISVNKIMATKINYKKNSNIFNEYDDIIKVDYGKNISSYLTKPVEDLLWLNEEIINYKKKLKNKRKPTDILIFTDGYSFSAAATFVKYIQYYGGGIIAGFFGNPKLNNTVFDSGQSASSVFQNDTLCLLSDSYKILNDVYNISMNMPGNQYFFDEMKLNEPLEYKVTPIDERVNIFHNYKDSYYDLFIKEALNIFNKYKTKCNPNNKKLVNMNSKCKEKFGDNFIFGGYECDEDGTWSNKCVYYFCDIGYVYDFKLNKCVLRKKEFNVIIIVRIFLIMICIINILALILYLYKYKEEDDKSDSQEEELIDIFEHS